MKRFIGPVVTRARAPVRGLEVRQRTIYAFDGLRRRWKHRKVPRVR